MSRKVIIEIMFNVSFICSVKLDINTESSNPLFTNESIQTGVGFENGEYIIGPHQRSL